MVDPRDSALAWKRGVLVLGAMSLALLVAVAVLLRGDAGRSGAAPRSATVADMVAETEGIMDSHPDPDVGRVLLPGLDARPFHGARVSTNAEGMAEREYVLPKPADVTRVVLLGDSYPFGWGVAAEERLGVHLERALVERATSKDGGPARIEVLHLAVPSWNIRSACAFLRRQLTPLAPDLVVLNVGINDLDDVADVRGFGAMSTFSSQHRERADGMVYMNHSTVVHGSSQQGLLVFGLDHEGRSRWERVEDDILRLDEAVRAAGGRLRLLFCIDALKPVARQHLDRLPDDLFVHLPAEFASDPAHRVTPTDGHWSARAHERLGALLYAVVQRQRLLPALELSPWGEADAEFEALHRHGAKQARRPVPVENLLRHRRIDPRLDFTALDDHGAAQIHGGVDADGRASPYVSFLLRNPGAARLRLELSGLGRVELPDVGLAVELEDIPVASVRVAADGRRVVEVELPAALAQREHLTVRLVFDDFVYAAEDRRHAVSARLHRAVLED